MLLPPQEMTGAGGHGPAHPLVVSVSSADEGKNKTDTGAARVCSAHRITVTRITGFYKYPLLAAGLLTAGLPRAL